MINVAKGRSANYSNLEFVLDDFLQANFQAESFDCIVTIATLHHLPLDKTLMRIKSLLRPGGVLILHDLLAAGGYIDRAFDAVRLPLSMAAQFWRTGRFRARREVRQAWIEHGKGESYLTPQEVLAMRDEHLPGGLVCRHLLWRYTVVWRKPCQS
jgi:SAM-dependent methyltransferase